VRAAVENASSGGGQMKQGSDAAWTGIEDAIVSAQPTGAARKEPRLSYASVTRDGGVKIEETKTFSQSK
jgi:hypothetical protein